MMQARDYPSLLDGFEPGDELPGYTLNIDNVPDGAGEGSSGNAWRAGFV